MSQSYLPTRVTLEARIEALNAAIASGARSVTLGGQTITYNTTDSLIKARNDAVTQWNESLRRTQADEGQTKRSRQSYVVYGGRGYD